MTILQRIHGFLWRLDQRREQKAREKAIQTADCRNCHQPLFVGEIRQGLCAHCQKYSLHAEVGR